MSRRRRPWKRAVNKGVPVARVAKICPLCDRPVEIGDPIEHGRKVGHAACVQARRVLNRMERRGL